jgi:hypothetical protein
MELSFTIYTWYENNCRVQQANFRRWNRNIASGKEKFDVIVFYSDENARKSMEKFANLRFWRLHSEMINFPTSLLNEAIRYSRSNILLFVSPWTLVRKNDLYCLANRVRSEYTLAWTSLKRRYIKTSKTRWKNFLGQILWFFNIGRLEVYAHLNHPFDFYDCGFFAFNKKTLEEIFMQTGGNEKIELFQADQKPSGALNFFLFHILKKYGAGVYKEVKLRSFIYEKKYPHAFYSYKSSMDFIRMAFKEKDFHYRLNIYRVLLPVMQLTQLAFFILVWFEPVKSLSLIGFYIILASGLLVELFVNRKTYPVFMMFFWFLSWSMV